MAPRNSGLEKCFLRRHHRGLRVWDIDGLQARVWQLPRSTRSLRFASPFYVRIPCSAGNLVQPELRPPNSNLTLGMYVRIHLVPVKRCSRRQGQPKEQMIPRRRPYRHSFYFRNFICVVLVRSFCSLLVCGLGAAGISYDMT